MTFTSIVFVILFIVTYVLCYICKLSNHRHLILLISSYIFYGYWDIRFLLLLFVQTYISYYLALKIQNSQLEAHSRRYMIIGIIISLGILGFFKYFNFFVETFYKVFGVKSHTLNIILPVGISFYTFQALSYLIDVYKRKIQARTSFVKLSLYIVFFPQLVAGPIVRASDFLPQLDKRQLMNFENLVNGFQIFLFGLIKKVVIADRLAVCVDAVFSVPECYSGISILLAVISYSIQIYCDFSGYSDMAIGIAKAFGFELCQNFNLPYLSENVTEFWKRWHISLSKWLQDYLYISLGGNRKGQIRTYCNLMITMLLGGLWHGADWKFVFWGLLQGIGLVIHKIFRNLKIKYNIYTKNKCLKILYKCFSIIATYLFICVGWIFFRASSFSDALKILRRICGNVDGISYYYIYTFVFIVFLIIAYGVAIIKNHGNGFYLQLDVSDFKVQIFIWLLIFLIAMFFFPGDTAFIYFQF